MFDEHTIIFVASKIEISYKVKKTAGDIPTVLLTDMVYNLTWRNR